MKRELIGGPFDGLKGEWFGVLNGEAWFYRYGVAHHYRARPSDPSKMDYVTGAEKPQPAGMEAT